MRNRVPLKAPLTPSQAEVVELVAQGNNFQECSAKLGISYMSVIDRAQRAANKIPSDLPAWPRLIVWARGADQTVLGSE